uniref:Bifunctional lysine-specific demethylase and histidyl-hydroxylase n=1 Tax=Timema tahoe TaxID=61484 RepID=A0A7R9I9M5_9NEOP|nr:unnamed protein product [Timema tahoe]
MGPDTNDVQTLSAFEMYSQRSEKRRNKKLRKIARQITHHQNKLQKSTFDIEIMKMPSFKENGKPILQKNRKRSSLTANLTTSHTDQEDNLNLEDTSNNKTNGSKTRHVSFQPDLPVYGQGIKVRNLKMRMKILKDFRQQGLESKKSKKKGPKQNNFIDSQTASVNGHEGVSFEDNNGEVQDESVNLNSDEEEDKKPHIDDLSFPPPKFSSGESDIDSPSNVTDVLTTNANSVVGKEAGGRKKKIKKEGGSKTKTKIKQEKQGMIVADSVEEGKKLFSWLIDPILPEDFIKDTWETCPMVLQRSQPSYYDSLLSTPAINEMLKTHNIQYTKNIDITSFSEGKRETHNPVGRAHPAVVWDYYSTGCSVRLLNPQTYIPKLRALNATLQEYFGCFVGANSYLTPPESQGFAPHYDDIEAFILQIEGKKKWRLYAPRKKQEVLPQFSSGNLTDDEIGKPVMEVTLNPGDLLYFPRGIIHQGHTVPGCHSLHITLSCYQRNTWGDLLEKLIPAALKIAMEEDVSFRQGLPVGYLNYMGVVNTKRDLPQRQQFLTKARTLFDKLFEYAPVDAAADQMGKQFMHDALPPVLTPEEKQSSVFGDGLRMISEGKVVNRVEIEPDTKVKLVRAQALRLVTEGDDNTVRLYHTLDNSLEYHGEEPQFLELAVDHAPIIEHLILSYPKFVSVSDLPLDDLAQKLQIVSDLWERGLLLTEGPLDIIDD